jgi:hypothetical protein
LLREPRSPRDRSREQIATTRRKHETPNEFGVAPRYFLFAGAFFFAAGFFFAGAFFAGFFAALANVVSPLDAEPESAHAAILVQLMR